jgi:hypothetical protein
MEDIMLETCDEPNIILGSVQRQMDNLTISNKEASISRRIQDHKTHHTENQGVGGGFFEGTIPNINNDPTATHETRQRMEMDQMNRTIQQMQNEIKILRRNENFISNPRMSEERRNTIQEKRTISDGTIDEYR